MVFIMNFDFERNYYIFVIEKAFNIESYFLILPDFKKRMYVLYESLDIVIINRKSIFLTFNAKDVQIL